MFGEVGVKKKKASERCARVARGARHAQRRPGAAPLPAQPRVHPQTAQRLWCFWVFGFPGWCTTPSGGRRLAMLGVFAFLSESKVPGAVPALSFVKAYDGDYMAPFSGNFHLF